MAMTTEHSELLGLKTGFRTLPYAEKNLLKKEGDWKQRDKKDEQK